MVCEAIPKEIGNQEGMRGGREDVVQVVPVVDRDCTLFDGRWQGCNMFESQRRS